MPYAGSPSQVDSAGQPPEVALISVNLSPCERDAGQPPGVALSGVNLRPPQATRKGWPYYTRRLHKPYDTFVSRRATPCGWPASRSHGLKLTPMGVALSGVNLRPPQATRKGWPYYTRRLHKPYDTFVSRRATPCGWPASRSHGLKLTPMGVALSGVNLRPPQATRQGWPYYTRRLHKPYDTFVSSRATPCGWPASRAHGLKLTPMGVALLYTTPCGAARAARLE